MSPAVQLLIVEDDADTRFLIESVLRTEGFEVTAADGAERALEVLASGTFDLVLTDYKLGTMDGVAFAREVWKRHPTLGLAVLSGARGLGPQAWGSDPRLLAYFEKPVYDLRKLARTLRDAHAAYRVRVGSESRG